MIAPATRGIVILSFTLTGRISIRVAPSEARLPENRFTLGEIQTIKRAVRRKAMLPSRVFPKILILPIHFPIRAAAVSARMRMKMAAMAMGLGKRRMVRIVEKIKYVAPMNVGFSSSLRTLPKKYF